MIRKIITVSATVSTMVGTGTFADGTGTAAKFAQPYGIAVDTSGNIYVADTRNHRIRMIAPSGVVTTLAGSGAAGSADGTGTSAKFNQPYGVAVDPTSGNLIVTDYNNNKIRKVTQAGVVTTLAGSGSSTWADGTGAAASFKQPTGVAIYTDGTIYVMDRGNYRLRRITQAGVVTTLAGSGTQSLVDGVGASASFYTSTSYYAGIAVDVNGTVWVTDGSNNKFRSVATDGTVTTPAALIVSPNGGVLYYPYAIAIDPYGNIFVTDYGSKIRMVTPTGTYTTIAGGSAGYVDGSGQSALFSSPNGIAIDQNGTLYVADTSNSRIRKMMPQPCPKDTYYVTPANCAGAFCACKRCNTFACLRHTCLCS